MRASFHLPGRLAVLFALVGTLAAGCGGESPDAPRAAGSRDGASDVFVIVLDTARQDVYSIFNEKIPIGRALADLARDGVVLDDLRAPSSWTRTSIASLLTGLTPAKHRVFGRTDVLPQGLPTLATYLQSKGYTGLGWSANPNILALWGFGEGFERLIDAGRRSPKDAPPEAVEVFALARETIGARARDAAAGPSFYYIHLIDPHAPYSPPPAQLAAVRALEDELVETFPLPLTRKRAQTLWSDQYLYYVAEVRDLDEQLGAFLSFLHSEGLYDSSLILVISDHGEEFLDHGGLRHGRTLYEEMLRVPGVLKLPGNRLAGTRLLEAADMHDLLPTILSALGLEIPPGVQGRPLLGTEPPAVLPQVSNLVLDGRRLAAVRYEGWKLIADFDSGAVELYDLAQDPKEKRDLSAREPARVAELRAMLDRLSARHTEGWHLRACGCGQSSELRFALRGAGEPTRARFEADDVIARGEDGALEISLVLEPSRWTAEGLRIPRKVVVGDRDELRFEASAGSPAVRAQSGALRFALGNGEVASHVGWLELTGVVDRARLRSSEPVLCMPDEGSPWSPEPTACEPHLRIWYAEAPEALPASAVDPEIVERLKVLGYDW